MALTATFEGLAYQTLLVELDRDVAAVWETVLGGEANWLARRILRFLLDPPYTAGGKRAGTRLYRHWEVDPASLFEACCHLRGDFLMTYDDAPEIHALAARHGLKVRWCLMSGSSHRRELGFPAAVALFSPQGSSIRSLVR